MENKLMIHRNYPDDATAHIKHLLKDLGELAPPKSDLQNSDEYEQWVEQQASLADDILGYLTPNAGDCLAVGSNSEGDELNDLQDSDSEFDC
jgi:hypothetical protein